MPQNPFDQKKAFILSGINSAKNDLSPKGTIDQLCLPIITLINSHNDMVTTSSCSGRISIFVEGSKKHKNNIKVGGKGNGGYWLFVSHNKENLADWTANCEFSPENNEINQESRLILYKFEPFILHVKCRDFDMASKLFNLAMSCGFRESGIGSNNIVAIRINIKLDIPIGYYDEKIDKLKLFVTKDYINILNQLVIKKFNENFRKLDDLYKKIDTEIIKYLDSCTK